VEPGTRAYQRIVSRFGPTILSADRRIDRKKLGALVFADRDKRRQLEAITHPAIMVAMTWQIFFYFITGRPAVVLDLPLLYESGPVFPRLCSKVVVVATDAEQQTARLLRRDHITPDEAAQRITAQMPLDQKMARADLVLHNDASIEKLLQSVDQLLYQPLLKPTWSRRLTAWFYVLAFFGLLLLLVWLFIGLIASLIW
jgi:dephospho-CoA kinase